MEKKEKHKKIYKYLTIIFIAIAVVMLASAAMPLETMPTQFKHPGFKVEPNEFTGYAEPPKSVIETELTDDMEDQRQDSRDIIPVPPPSFPPIGPFFLIQKVRNDNEPMQGFKLLLGRHNIPTNSLIIGIIDEPLSGDEFRNLNNWVLAIEMQPAKIPEGQFGWVSIEPYQDTIDIPAGEDFWIAVASTDFDNTDGNWYEWATSGRFGNEYNRGHMKYTLDAGDSWEHGPNDEDCCFITYTGGEQPPGPDSDFCINEGSSYTYQGTTYTVNEITSGLVILSTQYEMWSLRQGDTFTTDEGLTFEVVEVTENHACFLDITDEQPEPEEPPDISISIDTWTNTTVVAGFSSLFAAVVSGSRFFGLF